MVEEIQAEGAEVGHAVDYKDLVNSMNEKLESISKSPPSSTFHICRVPATIRKDNHVYYNPKIVSIGPFHRPRRNLRAMEEHKWRYLQRVRKYCTLDECVKKLTEIPVEKTRKCYSGNINMPNTEFVKMMLLDGSFIIQLLLRRKEIEEDEDDPILRNIWMMPAIAADMLLLENQLPFCVLECLAKCIGGSDPKVLNQEAFLFLSEYLPGTLDFKKSAYNETLLKQTSDEIHHLLHLVHWSLKPAPPNTEKLQTEVEQHQEAGASYITVQHQEAGASSITVQHQEAGASSITVQHQEAGASSITVQEAGASSITEETQEGGIPTATKLEELAPPNTEKPFYAQPLQVVRKILSFLSLRCLFNNKHAEGGILTATELEEAGVGFEINKGASFLDVTFKNGVMRLPRLQITDYTNSLFRNIIAFEQCFPDSGGAFTSYCIFIDSLLNTPRDVQILKQSHIIENKLGSDEEVALLFNQLCKEIAGNFGEGSLKEACEDVNEYSRACWPKSRARLKHDYFSNPWAVISFIAAAYALFLASVSTYYAVF